MIGHFPRKFLGRSAPFGVLAASTITREPKTHSLIAEEQFKRGGWRLDVGVFCIPKDDSNRNWWAWFGGSDRKICPVCCGEDAYAIFENAYQAVVAIADGVGGWRKKGIDPSVFSRSLMHHLSQMISTSGVSEISFKMSSSYSRFEKSLISDRDSGSASSEKLDLVHENENSDSSNSHKEQGGHELPLISSALMLTKGAFWRMVTAYREGKEVPFGSSTVCVLSLDKDRGILDTVNVGDSGFLVVRPLLDYERLKSQEPLTSPGCINENPRLQIVYRSPAQQHRFNAPFQMSLRPPKGEVGDETKNADERTINLRKGDVIILATDGVWDNLHETDLISLIPSAIDNPRITARDIAMAAYSASHQGEDYRSPFVEEAIRQGLGEKYGMGGGKPDDITVIVAVVQCK